jgi:ADP-heptose:LPS heptosyltransferase
LNQPKRALLFFSAGIGDSILLTPLANALIERHYIVDGVFTSEFNCHELFSKSNLLQHTFLLKSKLQFLLFAFKNIRRYDVVFLNHFANNTSNLWMANIISKQIILSDNNTFKLIQKKIIKRIAQPNIHDSLQNLKLFLPESNYVDLNFDLHLKQNNNPSANLPKSKYAIAQISAGNNKTPYKNWPIDNWIELFKQLEKQKPWLKILLLGDKNEMELSSAITMANLKNVESQIGKTSVMQLVEITSQCSFYIGLDSGIMHLAAALNKPTFSIWGASSSKLYGYGWKGKNHKIVRLKLDCSPCSAWLYPNNSRVSNPTDCPDFKCLRELDTQLVLNEMSEFLAENKNLLPA